MFGDSGFGGLVFGMGLVGLGVFGGRLSRRAQTETERLELVEQIDTALAVTGLQQEVADTDVPLNVREKPVTLKVIADNRRALKEMKEGLLAKCTLSKRAAKIMDGAISGGKAVATKVRRMGRKAKKAEAEAAGVMGFRPC